MIKEEYVDFVITLLLSSRDDHDKYHVNTKYQLRVFFLLFPFKLTRVSKD